MPARIASAGEWNTTGSPLMRIWPSSGLIQAVELAHQRALAGAILAQQRVHLARVHIKVDVIVGQHARKALDDAAHLQPLNVPLRNGLCVVCHE